jgi:hypothetical protein
MDTARPFKRTEYRAQHKALFRAGCAALAIEYPTVGAVCDENVSTIKAWADPHRDHAIPDWAMRRIRRELPALAAYIDTGMDVFDGCGASRDAEGAGLSAARALSIGAATICTALPDGVLPSEAGASLPALLDARAQLDAVIAAFRAREDGASVTPIDRAKGGA